MRPIAEFLVQISYGRDLSAVGRYPEHGTDQGIATAAAGKIRISTGISAAVTPKPNFCFIIGDRFR